MDECIDDAYAVVTVGVGMRCGSLSITLLPSMHTLMGRTMDPNHVSDHTAYKMRACSLVCINGGYRALILSAIASLRFAFPASTSSRDHLVPIKPPSSC